MKFRRIIFICFILTLLVTLTELRADDEASIEFERFSEREKRSFYFHFLQRQAV